MSPRVLVLRAGEEIPGGMSAAWIACDHCGRTARARGRVASPPPGWRVLGHVPETVCECASCAALERQQTAQDVAALVREVAP